MAARQTFDVKRVSVALGDSEITIETGKLAGQAGGAVTIQLADTMLFCSATMNPNVREGMDFFPLSVEFEEKLYAAGRIPGGFLRREGRPPESAILNARVIDRPLRPLFPDGMRNEVQVIVMPLSHDQENQMDMLGITAASCALMISDIPWNGPVAGVRIGYIDGELVIDPTLSQMANSTLDLRVAVTKEAINMVECGAEEIDEEIMVQALELAFEAAQPILDAQIQLAQEIGKAKQEVSIKATDAELEATIAGKIYDQITGIIAEQTERDARNEAVEAVRETLMAEYEAHNEATEDEAAKVDLKEVREILNSLVKKAMRARIVNDGIRPDGRDYYTIRPLAAEVGVVPRVHGSGLFSRGETQVLSIATLGTPRDAQEMDTVAPEDNKRYMHHYNFPPYSTGEAYPMRGPKRREIGHGALAETALRSMLPAEDEYPYVLRVVSEVMSSNGSTSMASVCGSTLALLHAGVPLKAPVAGIAMGLIKEGDKVAVLTDIQGMEDHFGDMDFKVAGSRNGITALQMDIKITGVTQEVMRQALKQARDARLEILDLLEEVMPEANPEPSQYAPRMESVKINPEKIGAVIGPGGKVIRGIQERTGAKIDIQEDGTVFISGVESVGVQMAIEEVRSLTEDPEIGRIYTGRVTRTESYGAFVEFLPNREGMVHISQLADYRVESVEDECKVGDEIMVMITSIDDGKVRLSRQAVLEGWTAEEAQARDSRPSGGRSRSGGGDRRGGGGDRRGGGGDRRGGGGDRRGGGGDRRGGGGGDRG